MQPLPSSEAILNTYDGWAAQRHTRLGTELKFEGQSYRDSRMAGDVTFSRNEVTEMLDGQLKAVLGLAVKEQESVAASSRSLILAILRENDRQRVPVDIDAQSALNQGSNLLAVEAAEQKLAAKGSMRLGALPALNTAEAQARQLSEAHEEIRRLNERMRAMQQRFEEAMSDRSKLNQDVLSMQDTLGNMRTEHSQMTEAQQATMQQQNVEFKKEIASLQRQLIDAQKELSGKLSQSTQFTTLKRMLNEKNDIVKTLRSHLMKYDPSAAAIGGDDIEAADDDD